MKIIIINGSPRKNGNTAKLLKSVKQGADFNKAEVEFFNLYDLNFKGCKSCLTCKLKNSKNYGKCILKDEATLLIEKIENSDALIIGSPIYFGSFSGSVHSFIERLLYPKFIYGKDFSSLFNKKLKTAIFLTMNVNEERMIDLGYMKNFELIKGFFKKNFGNVEIFISNDTLLFDDSSKYDSGGFDIKAKLFSNQEIFPIECEKAYELGVRFSKL